MSARVESALNAALLAMVAGVHLYAILTMSALPVFQVT